MTRNGNCCSDDSLAVVVAEDTVECGVCRKDGIGGEDEDWVWHGGTGAGTDRDVRERGEVVEAFKDDLIFAGRNPRNLPAALSRFGCRLERQRVGPDGHSDITEACPLIAGHRPLGSSRVFEKIDLEVVDCASHEDVLGLREPAIRQNFECVLDADGKSRQAEGARRALRQRGRRYDGVAGGYRDHCATKTDPARIHNARDAPDSDGQPGGQRGSRLAGTQIGGDHFGPEAVAADADHVPRWGADAFNAPLAQGLVCCRRRCGVRELTITDGHDRPSKWAIGPGDRPPECAVSGHEFDFHWFERHPPLRRHDVGLCRVARAAERDLVVEPGDQSSVGPAPVLRRCEFNRSVVGIKRDGLRKSPSKDLSCISCRAAGGRVIRRRIVKRDASKADGDPAIQAVVRAPEFHGAFLVEAHPGSAAVPGGFVVCRGRVVPGIVGRRGPGAVGSVGRIAGGDVDGIGARRSLIV